MPTPPPMPTPPTNPSRPNPRLSPLKSQESAQAAPNPRREEKRLHREWELVTATSTRRFALHETRFPRSRIGPSPPEGVISTVVAARCWAPTGVGTCARRTADTAIKTNRRQRRIHRALEDEGTGLGPTVQRLGIVLPHPHGKQTKGPIRRGLDASAGSGNSLSVRVHTEDLELMVNSLPHLVDGPSRAL